MGLKGLGDRDGIKMHNCRATNFTKILEGGHQGVGIYKRTGHPHLKGLDKLTSERGSLGRGM